MCLEVAVTNGVVVIRNPRRPDGPAVSYTAAEWRAFLEKAKKGEFDNVSADNQVPVSAPGRPDQFGTADLRAFLRGLIYEATENDDALRRHIKLFRSTVLAGAAVVLAGSLIFGAGVAAVVAVAGVHVAVAIGIGAGGSATFVVTAAVQGRRYVKAVLSTLSEADPRDSPSGPKGTSENGGQRTAA